MTGRWHHLLELSYIHPRQRSVSNHLVVVLPSPLHRPTSSLSPRDHGQMHHCTRCSRIYAPACQCTFVKQLPPTSGGATKELACLRTTNNYLTGEACEVPQLVPPQKKTALESPSHPMNDWGILWYIIYIYIFKRFPGDPKRPARSSNLRWTSIPTKKTTHPPERQSDARVKSRSKPLATKPPARPFQALLSPGKSKITHITFILTWQKMQFNMKKCMPKDPKMWLKYITIWESSYISFTVLPLPCTWMLNSPSSMRSNHPQRKMGDNEEDRATCNAICIGAVLLIPLKIHVEPKKSPN